MAAFDDYYLSQLKLAEATSITARREWRKMRTLDDWPKVQGRVTVAVAAGQAGAARDAVTCAQNMGIDSAPLNTSSFAGLAADGRPLDSLLYRGVIHGQEMSPKPEQQLLAGEQWLNMAVQSELADAGRGATSAIITATKTLGYYRLVSSPCCQRCAVLAGKWFEWNKGFLRHPRCRCRHVPAKRGAVPDGYTDRIDPAQIRDLTVEQRQAIAEGADPIRVMNAHRHGRMSRDGMSTLELAPRGSLRLTPEGIYRKADGDRDKAIELLQQHGYIRTPTKQVPVTVEAPKPVRLTVETTAEWSDDQLDDALIAAFEREDGDTVSQLEAIMNARDVARQEAELLARLERVKSSDPSKFTDAEIDAFTDDEFAAWKRNMQQVDSDSGIWREVGVNGKKLTTEQQLRADYETYVYTEWMKAEQATNGNLFNRANKLKGYDPVSLWSGPWHVAQSRASEELLRHWQQHPRINFATFKFQSGQKRFAQHAAAAVKQTWQG